MNNEMAFNKKKDYGLFISIILVLTFLPLISAYTLEDAILKTNDESIIINVSGVLNVTQVIVYSNAIYLQNITYFKAPTLWDCGTKNVTTAGTYQLEEIGCTRTSTGTGGTTSGGGSGILFNKTLICDYAEQFLKENIIPNGFNYSYDDIVNLTSLINIYSAPNIQVSTMELYLKNFEKECNRSNPKYSDIKKSEGNFTFIKITSENISCSPDINKKAEVSFGFFSIGYDMDWYIPFFKIDVGKMSCESKEFWRWIFKYKSNGENYYSFLGFKLWWVLITIIVIFVWWFFIGKRKENKKINKLLDKKLRS